MLAEWGHVDDLPPAELDAVERRTREVGQHLFAHLDERRPHLLQRRWWDDRIMEWAMQDESLKIQLFRFVDVLPMLGTSAAVVEHLQEHLDQVRTRLPMPIRSALGIGRRTTLTRAAVARVVRLGVMDLARRFIAGTNVREVVAAAERERNAQRGFTLDILGEAVTSEHEAEQYFHAYRNLIERVAPQVNQWPENPQIDQGALTDLPRINLSVKLSALDAQFDALDPDGALRRAGDRFRELLRVARQHNAFINVDMESYAKKDLTLYVFQQVLMEDEFRDVGDVGIAIQCYLRDTAADLTKLLDWTRRRRKPIWVRLVKGAYWDYETVHALAEGWPIPVYQQKWQSDACFERATRFVMRHHKFLRPALGTHNLRSIAHGVATAEQLELPPSGFEVQMLYGMADKEKRALVGLGHRLRIYMPYGALIPGMAYLVRRLLENTSNDSFLRAGFVENVGAEQLLRQPLEVGQERTPEGPEEAMSDNPSSDPLRSMFENHPPVDFAVRANRHAMQEALQTVMMQLGRDCPLVIGGHTIETDEKLRSIDPSFKDRLVGEASLAERQHVDQAVAAAKTALVHWHTLGAKRRAEFLRRAAQAIRDQFFELAAWEVYECGKGWREATGDICEAIDFCEYYAAGAVALEEPQGGDVPGEENRFGYLPRGVTAVIAPWNFPLAILTGMTTAALATGNTVIMKPAGQSPVVASLLMGIFTKLDLPPGVLNYVPGRGEVVGAALVEHPDVAVVAFTGSREVGLQINASAAAVSAQGLGYVKRVIAEMGGKNAIIIAEDADLDEAVTGVVQSAFGYQGQKCSACSRVIVVGGVYDTFLTRLVEAAKSLQLGAAEFASTDVGPVINQQAVSTIHQHIAVGQQEAREALAVKVDEKLAAQGFYVGPHVFVDVPPGARIAQEEIFGPVLAVIRAADLTEAISIANSTDYALTGGLYSRSPVNLQRARRELLVGNLYLNRSITGAVVGRQPFGGFKLSGIGSKAGGPDYLLQFVLPQTVSENTIRRGFAPE